MRATVVLPLIGALARLALAQTEPNAFEESDFNVTQALLDQGVEPSELPDVSENKRSSGPHCAAAVSCTPTPLHHS